MTPLATVVTLRGGVDDGCRRRAPSKPRSTIRLSPLVVWAETPIRRGAPNRKRGRAMEATVSSAARLDGSRPWTRAWAAWAASAAVAPARSRPCSRLSPGFSSTATSRGAR
jgi:hypothetical protein